MRILFLSRTPNVRLLRQAMALHQSGRHTLHLMYSNALPLKRYLYRVATSLLKGRLYRHRRPDADLLSQIFDGIYLYRNFEELRTQLRAVKIDLIHAHAEPNQDVRVALETVSVPLLFDPTDITSLRFSEDDDNREELQAERFIFAHAQGYIHKGPEVEYVRQTYSYDGPTLHFENYCVDEWIVEEPLTKLSERDGEWHITFAGGIAPLFFSAKRWGYKQYDTLARELARQKIHLHLYGSPYHNVNSLVSYQREAARNPYLHLHDSVLPHRIALETSQYDLGMWVHPRADQSELRDWMWNTSIGNKFYSYLESGLPLLVNDDLRFGSEMVRKYGVGIVFNYDDVGSLSQILENADIAALVDRVRAARRELLMSRHIARLNEFYEAVAARQV